MLIDNKNNLFLKDVFEKFLGAESQVYCLTSQFSLHCCIELRKQLLNIKALSISILNWDESKLQDFVAEQSEVSLRSKFNYLDQLQAVKTIVESAKIYSCKIDQPIQDLFIIINPDGGSVAIQGSLSLTAAGLGSVFSDSVRFSSLTTDAKTIQHFKSLYDQLTNNNQRSISHEIIDYIEPLTQGQASELVYYYTLNRLFPDLEKDPQETLKNETGFKETLVWQKLYEFQKDGVLGAISKIEEYNGCIIADSVGLGKTFEALAVIKYYELRNDRVLVLCPKKLRENWTMFTNNDARNLFASDRFNYDVLNHTDLTRFRGRSGEINLETLNWSNYDLIVIDESHNFRNNDPKKEKVTRYSRLMDDLIRSGVKSKLLMLSATPVNNRLNDLKNQIAFITEGDEGRLADYGIKNINSSLVRAQTKFNEWLTLPDHQRNTKTLVEMLNQDYFSILELLTIARSRKHIEKYYDTSKIGKFPERLKPQTIKSEIDASGEFPPLSNLNVIIQKLNLSAYSPISYVRLDKRQEYSKKYDTQLKDGRSVFTQVDREKSLIHLVRINLMKRLESSINSFFLTISKLEYKISCLLEKLDNISATSEELDINEIDIDSEDLREDIVGTKTKVLLKDLDLEKYKHDLEEDLVKVRELATISKTVDSARDQKLITLKSQIDHKIENPINPNNKKVIIFTAFADTANYLYENMARYAAEKYNIKSALVSGSGKNQTNLLGCKNDLNSILTNFSPRSKEKEKYEHFPVGDIDLLIATDCISEGQNLQDCDYLVNYDIHWNPVRIIQRFGRIDRLGSNNSKIQLVNFFPNMELDEYINLEARVSGRMVLLDISATGEENVIEQGNRKSMNDLDYRKKQLMQLQEKVVDLEDIEGGISITDMNLGNLKSDLQNFLKPQRLSLKEYPQGMYAVVNSGGVLPAGVVLCLKDLRGRLAERSPIWPYYICYVGANNATVYNPVQFKLVLEHLKPHLLEEEIKYKVTPEDLRSHLLTATEIISGKTREDGVKSLFQRGGISLQKNSRKSHDFDLISAIIVE